MFPGIHDSLLVAYSARSEPTELVLSMLPHHGSAPGPFSVVFRDVAAHCFATPLLPAILFDITPLSAEELLRSEWPSIARGYKQCGWPGPWAETLPKAIGFATSSGLEAFRIESSYGLEGWVLAGSAEVVA